jgi:hypothetical protein
MRAWLLSATIAACAIALPLGCSSETGNSASDAGPVISLGEGGYVDAPDRDAYKPKTDGGFVGPDGSVLREDRFITRVVSFTPGSCAGFGASDMPGVVLGPPVGAGDTRGGLDVVSLGIGGEIVLSFEPNEIVDQPGPDFIVFENAFFAAGNPTSPAADLGEVSVSADGRTWKTFACTPGASAPYGACSGWRPVYSAPDNAISPIDVAKAGGEAYDLADVGLANAKLVRIRDLSTMTCDGMPKPVNLGYDLDAIAIVHAKFP